MIITWDGYLVIRNDTHAHPDFHTIELVRVRYNENGQVIEYSECSSMEDISLDTIINEVSLMVAALEKPPINKSAILGSVLQYSMSKIKNAK